MREDHAEALRIYRECLDVEQALTTQVLEAIDEKFTKCFKNRLTQRVDMSLEDLFANLFARYGLVTSHELAAFEREVREHHYDVVEPLSTVHDLIDDLQLMGEAAHLPYSEQQLVQYALDILRNTNEFQDGIKTWNRRAPNLRTWANFITHFDTEYNDLLQLRGPTMRNSNMHQANEIIAQVTENVNASVDAAIKRHVANSTIMGEAKRMAIPNVGNIPPELQNLPPGYSVQEISTPPPNAAFSANATSSDMATFMKVFLKKMEEQDKTLRATLLDITNRGGAGGYAGGSDGGLNARARGGGNAKYRRRNNVSKYCWTHGACAHDSRSCRNKAHGHIDTATFSNKMGGSTKFCNPQE